MADTQAPVASVSVNKENDEVGGHNIQTTTTQALKTQQCAPAAPTTETTSDEVQPPATPSEPASTGTTTTEAASTESTNSGGGGGGSANNKKTNANTQQMRLDAFDIGRPLGRGKYGRSADLLLGLVFLVCHSHLFL